MKNFISILLLIVLISPVSSSYALFGQKRARVEAEQRAAQAEAELGNWKQKTEEIKVERRTSNWAFGLAIMLLAGGLLYASTHRKIVHKTVQQVVNVHAPAHDIVVNSVVIDGTNVVRQSNGNSISLSRLLGVLIELEKKKYTYKCYFDANTFHVLRESGLGDHAQAYRELLERYSAVFIEVPGRTRADDAILDYAHRHGTPIISNDQYRNYKEKYRWLEEDSKWRVPFVVHPSMLQLYRLGINANVPENLKTALTEFRVLVQKNVSRN